MLSNDELARKTMRDGGRRNTITVRDLTFSFVYILLQFAQNGGGTGPTPREVETLHNMRSRQALVPQPAQGKRVRILLHPQRKDRYQSFDTYSPHLVTYNGKEYPTSEHLYQAFKVRLYFIYRTHGCSLDAKPVHGQSSRHCGRRSDYLEVSEKGLSA
jgi:hypothetical protein